MQLSNTSMQIQHKTKPFLNEYHTHLLKKQSVLLYREETGRRGVPPQNMTLQGLQT